MICKSRETFSTIFVFMHTLIRVLEKNILSWIWYYCEFSRAKNTLKYSSKSVIIARKSQLLIIIYLGSNFCKKCTNARLRHVEILFILNMIYMVSRVTDFTRVDLSLKLLNTTNIQDCPSFSKLFVINLKGLIAD